MANDSYILLNKPFAGGWIDEDGHIAHEIINYFKADNGNQYYYNLPYGGIVNKEKLPDYIVLTGRSREGAVEIHYVIKPSKQMHSQKSITKDIKKAKKIREKIIATITDKDNEIQYNGKLLNEIFPESDVSLLLTYQVEWIKRYKSSEKFIFYKNQNEKHAHFYHTSRAVYANELPCHNNKNTYEMLSDLVADESKWENVEFDKVEDNALLPDFTTKTFLDFVIKQQSEDCYTGMLFNIFNKQNALLVEFLKFLGCNKDLSEQEFKLMREHGIKGSQESKKGRMDIAAESEKYRVVIENKIDSDLNDVNKELDTSQLDKYYSWAQSEGKEAICFLLVPNRNKEKIAEELGANNPFKPIGYTQIVKFIENNKADIEKVIKRYEGLNFDIVRILFDRQAHTEKETHEALFLSAIKKLKNN